MLVDLPAADESLLEPLEVEGEHHGRGEDQELLGRVGVDALSGGGLIRARGVIARLPVPKMINQPSSSTK